MKQTICQIFTQTRQREHLAYSYFENDDWQNKNWNDVFNESAEIFYSLMAIGVEPGTPVAIAAENQLTWCLLDYAIMGLGAITVPIAPVIARADFAFILNDSGAEYLFVQDLAVLREWYLIKEQCPKIKKVILLHGNLTSSDPEVLSFADFFALSQGSERVGKKEFLKSCLETRPEQMATLVYTSGTTEEPKAVPLTHAELLSEVTDTFNFLGICSQDKSVSILPFFHILGRIEHWGAMYTGASLCFVQNINKLREQVIHFNPSILLGVPRIFEKIHAHILNEINANPLLKAIFPLALKVGLEVSEKKEKGEAIPLHLAAQHKLYEETLFKNIRNSIFGHSLKFAVSGGAKLSPAVSRFFYAIGVLILEGYGLTETTGAVFCNRSFDFEIGSVGKPIGDVEFKIEPDGEIWIRSSKVSSYLQVQLNQAFVRENKPHHLNWFPTGDVGYVSVKNNLIITDRKKDLIKTSNGKYIAPQKIEALIKKYPFITGVSLHGEGRPYLVALFTLDRDFVLAKLKAEQIRIQDYPEAIKSKNIQDLMHQTLSEINHNLSPHETIKRYLILPYDFSIEHGEITATLKTRRKVIALKYREQIESLY